MSEMRCCEARPDARGGSAARSWRSTGACVGSGTMLVLLPKCPMCIAAYLAVWTGAGVAAPVAGHLRFVLAVIFAASLGFLIVRRLMLVGKTLG